MVVLMEIGSSSQFTVAALTANSRYSPFLIASAALVAQAISIGIAVWVGGILSNVPIRINLIQGIIMILIGLVMLFQK